MLFRKLRRTMRLYKVQFFSMILMIALGVGVFVGANTEWVSIEKNINYLFDNTGFADYRIISENGFTEEELDKIADIDGVTEAGRYLSVNADVREYSGDSLALTVTENSSVSDFMLISGSEYDENSADGIWLSDKYAEANGTELGDTLTLQYKNLEIKGVVKGFVKSGEYLICVRDESQLMPDYTGFGFAYISPAMYEKATGGDFYTQINVISDAEKKGFTESADDALDKTLLILSKDETISYSGAMGEVEEGKTMGSILPVLFILIAVLTMVTTMHRICAKEKTQIGTLKALGFKDGRIVRHYTSYALMTAAAGSIFGIILGCLIAWYIINPDGMMATYLDMPQWNLYIPWFCFALLIGLVVLLTFIGFLSVKKMLKGTAADALRPYTPKAVKNLRIEKSAVFHKLSFGTRWNLRDVMRHKSRSVMSLVGITGCMIILVASMGMRDTMESFLDVYYDGATNYSSRIYISEEADSQQIDELTDKYDGDWSASVSVQIEDKSVSLDVYSVENDLVRFPGKDGGYTEIGDGGAYICVRISDEYKLDVGDEFTVSPYGTDEKYTLAVAGVIRSVSENIVITPAYADSLGLAYTADSVYTDTEKSDIASDSAVKSVQSKQMIIDSFDTFTDMMNMMIFVFVAAGIILGIIVLYNLGVMSYTERYREMATLKVVGFKDRKIGRLLIGQNLWLSAVGIIAGLPLGAAVLDYLLKALASEYEMSLVISPATYIISLLLTLGMSLAVSLAVSRKNKKIDMAEALKSAE